LVAGAPAGWTGAVPLGLHLEGPFLTPTRRGAHRTQHLQNPDVTAVEGWTRDGGVAVVTLAPELTGALEVVEALVAQGVVVSLGHSAATAAEARAGIDAGATWVTHLWNAMEPLHHREPGLVGVALTDERVRAGLVVDGIHVDPTVVALSARALGERLVLVTDAVSVLGMPAGRHELGTVEVEAWRGRGVSLSYGTLAGSDIAMDQAVRNLRALTGCSVERALAAASGAPAALLGDARRGALEAGRRGDVVLLDDELAVRATVVAGTVVHDARS
jgi:N-acetylglucosamine-6-phosphate deacetylase